MELCLVKIVSGEFVGWCHADLQTDPEDVYNAFIEFKKDLSSGKAIIKGLRIKRNLLDSFLLWACLFLQV